MAFELVFDRYSEECEKYLDSAYLSEIKDREVSNTQDGMFYKEPIEHLLIEGENLLALNILLKDYENKVDVIYIDPPYNTGNTHFNYKDKFGQRADRHSTWLSMIEKRLMLAMLLLKDSGVIFISIDDNEQAQLKLLCDKIFGEGNYRNQIIIKRGFKNVQKQFKTVDRLSSGYEFILMYSKNNFHRFNRVDKDLVETKAGSWSSHWRATNRPTMRYELFGIIPESGQWLWSKKRAFKAIENYNIAIEEIKKKYEDITQDDIDNWYINQSDESIDLLRLSKNEKPEHYIPPTDSKLLNDVWFDFPPNGTKLLSNILHKKEFNNPKPIELIKRVIKFSICPNSIILDFFAGSGTTAHAVMELNKEDGGSRKCILVTNNENGIAEQVCYERVKRAIQGYTTPKGKHIDGLGGNKLKYYKIENGN